ncbi:hypothetical protein Ae201684P_013642 [Aphanomyces euteiches]|nr:hypothetical protein Ae201684P_013642 [Aphanomyces euteiches]
MATLESLEDGLEARLAANRRMQDDLEEMEARIIAFLNETDIDLNPAVENVSCQCIPEHFVPSESLASHLKRCHGIQQPDVTTCEFFYRHIPSVENVRATHQEPIQFAPSADPKAHFVDVISNPYEEATTDISFDEEVQSIVDTSTPASASNAFEKAVGTIAPQRQEFRDQVAGWKLIPAAFTSLDATRLHLPRIQAWIETWFETEKLQGKRDLVQYILGLFNQPSFCSPDLFVAELVDFLGIHTRRFVLALWKFLVVQIAQTVCFYDMKHEEERERVTKPLKTPSSFDETMLDRKRQRVTYRGKSSRKSAKEMMRDLVASQMAALGQVPGWNLIHEPETETRSRCRDGDNQSQQRKQDEMYVPPAFYFPTFSSLE